MAAFVDEHGELSTVDMTGRPASDPIAMERSRARVERALFGHERAAMLGRYEILEPVAGGGMGLVYAAYDPELDRKVALKVLHPELVPEAGGHERLLKEARALARLNHPNVVAVYDVLSHDGQVVVVMALLPGETLESWEQRTRRTPREIIDAYRQAGEGLAAAHSVDVIHRDFKPSNAIIGPDGHVRVLDFGLARMTSDVVVDHVSHRRAAALSKTVSGAFLGTLAYASPEQMFGRNVTAASDQFSFCVSLHRAIEGVAPFEGDTLPELFANIERGEVRLASDGRRVPVWLRQLLRRGLSADPAQRFQSMTVLLGELRRARGWQRWKWPVASATLVVTTAVVVPLLVGRGNAQDPCDGGATAMAAVWGGPQRAAVTRALDAAPTADIASRVLGGLDERARQWSSMHRDACLAHRRGTDSDALLDRKMRCLDQQLGDIDAAVSVVANHQTSEAERAIDVVASLPPASWCADRERLLDEPAPPATTSLDAQLRRIRKDVSRAAALDHGGRSDDALALARSAAAAADQTGYSPLIAEASLEVGRILIGRADPRDAVPVLEKARTAALGTGHQVRLAVEAGARLIYAEGAHTPDLELLERDLAFLVPMSAALVNDHFARPLLFNNAAEVYMMARHPDEARTYLQKARELRGSDASDIELTAIDRNLAAVAATPGERMQLAGDAWKRIRDVLGEHHLRTLQARAQYAAYQSDVAKADELLAPVCAEYARNHPALGDLLLDCELRHAVFTSELDHVEDARAAYQVIVDTTASSSSPEVARFRNLATAELALSRGALANAETAFRAVQLASDADDPWWDRRLAFQAELGLGIVALTRDQPAAARAHLEAAAAGFEDVSRASPDLMHVRLAAKARRLLAALPSPPEREHRQDH